MKLQPQNIQNLVYEIRGKNIMLDFDLATMYHVETRRLKHQKHQKNRLWTNCQIFKVRYTR